MIRNSRTRVIVSIPGLIGLLVLLMGAVCMALFLRSTADAKINTSTGKSSVDQSTYRAYRTSTTTAPGTPLAASNQPATLNAIADQFRVRLGVTNSEQKYTPVTMDEVQLASYVGCSLASDAWVYCWSDEDIEGILGTGVDAYNVSAPTPVSHGDIPNGATIKSITAAGNASTVCVVASDNWVYCWGDNDNGQIGDNTTASRNAPTALQRGAIPTGVTIKQVSLGDQHACAIGSDNRPYCWGEGDSGRLGNNANTDSLTPIAVQRGGLSSSRAVKAISAGGGSTCAIATNSKAYCWGANHDGRLGTGDTSDHKVPTAVVRGDMPSNFTVKAVTAGQTYTCFIGSDSKGYCNGYNDSGQLGIGSETDKDVPTAVVKGDLPSNMQLKYISASAHHTCAVAGDNKAYCWGGNSYGELGSGSTTDSMTPKAVVQGTIPVGVGMKSTSVSYVNSCAAADNGRIYCWGLNANNRTGIGSTGDTKTSPVTVLPGATSGGINVSAIDTGRGSTCGLADDERLYCWGWNNVGKLGDGTTTDRMTPVKLSQGATPAGSSVKSFAINNNSSCAVVSDGKAYCWGAGDSGQLGNGASSNHSSPVAVSQGNVPAGKTIESISVGNASACAVASDDWAYCWGSHSSGQGGYGAPSGSDQSTPKTIVRGAIPSGATIKTVAMGAIHACALASDNWVYCWGANNSGQLGNSSTTTSGTPVKMSRGAIPVGATIKSISTSGSHTCAIASNDQLYCWGANDFGQLGDNTTTNRTTPVKVSQGAMPSGQVAKSVSAGLEHTCAVASDNWAYCWGHDNNVQTGWNQSGEPLVPAKVVAGDVPYGTTITAVTAGYYNTCLIDSDNRAYCFGMNDDSGELGNGSEMVSSVPARVASGEYNPDHTIKANDTSFTLQYAPKAAAPTCSAVAASGWSDVTTNSALAFVAGNPAHGAAISSSSNDPTPPHSEGFSYQTIVRAGGSFSNVNDIAPQQTGLWDIALKDVSSQSAASYCLRLATAGPGAQSIDAYTYYPEITTATGSLMTRFVDSGSNTLSGSATSTGFTPINMNANSQVSTGQLSNATTKQLDVHNSLSNSGWNVSIAATNGPSSVWQSGTNTYGYNSSSANGQLKVNMSGSSVAALGSTPNGSACSATTGITKSTTNTAYQSGVVDAITLLSGSNSAGFNCNWRVRNIGLSQTVPAAQAAGSYDLDMTVTVVAQ